jgi:transposase
MSLCIKELGITGVIFIADKGFYSEKNIGLLDGDGLYYVIALKRNNPLTDCGPLSGEDFKKTGRHFLWQGRVIWYHEYARKGKAFVTYLDERLKVEEERDYLGRLRTHPETHREEGFLEKLHRFGTLTLTCRTGIPRKARNTSMRRTNSVMR